MSDIANIDINAFKERIDSKFKDNLPIKLRSTLSNILAIDYHTRCKDKIMIHKHVDSCIKKIGNFLYGKVVSDDSFSAAMTLFSIAIASDNLSYKDHNQELLVECSINQIIEMHFAYLSNAQKLKAKAILIKLIGNKDQKKIISQIHSNISITKTIVDGMIKLDIAIDKNSNNIFDEFHAIILRNSKTQNNVDKIKNFISKITTMTIGLSIPGLLLMTTSTLIPVAMIPSAIAMIKFGPKIGSMIGQNAINANGWLQDIQTKDNQAMENLLDQMSSKKVTAVTYRKFRKITHEHEKMHDKNIDKNELNNQEQINLDELIIEEIIDLDNIKDKVSQHTSGVMKQKTVDKLKKRSINDQSLQRYK
ncbi:MAG: RP853 family protein [Rickettsiaceae bacterium]